MEDEERAASRGHANTNLEFKESRGCMLIVRRHYLHRAKWMLYCALVCAVVGLLKRTIGGHALIISQLIFYGVFVVIII